jgi:hypothetical protein
VGRLLREAGLSLQANAKTSKGSSTRIGMPSSATSMSRSKTIRRPASRSSASTRNKSSSWVSWLTRGREWRPRGEPVEVADHSFFVTGPDVAHAIAYGVYDLER